MPNTPALAPTIGAYFNDDCAICHEPLQAQNSALAALQPCGHLFHMTCINKLCTTLQARHQTMRCPLCKSQGMQAIKLECITLGNERNSQTQDTRYLSTTSRQPQPSPSSRPPAPVTHYPGPASIDQLRRLGMTEAQILRIRRGPLSIQRLTSTLNFIKHKLESSPILTMPGTNIIKSSLTTTLDKVNTMMTLLNTKQLTSDLAYFHQCAVQLEKCLSGISQHLTTFASSYAQETTGSSIDRDREADANKLAELSTSAVWFTRRLPNSNSSPRVLRLWNEEFRSELATPTSAISQNIQQLDRAITFLNP